MRAFVYWTLILAGNLGLVSLVIRLGPRIWGSLRDIADMYAPGADWPALTVAGIIGLSIWGIA